MRHPLRIAILSFVLLGLLGAQTYRSASERRLNTHLTGVMNAALLAGSTLPVIAGIDATGKRETLDVATTRLPTVLFFVSAQDLLTCANYSNAGQEIVRRYDHVVVRTIAVDRDTTNSRRILNRQRLLKSTLFVNPDTLEQTLGTSSVPFVLVVSPSGRVLISDVRAPSQFGRFGIDEIIGHIDSMLAP